VEIGAGEGVAHRAAAGPAHALAGQVDPGLLAQGGYVEGEVEVRGVDIAFGDVALEHHLRVGDLAGERPEIVAHPSPHVGEVGLVEEIEAPGQLLGANGGAGENDQYEGGKQTVHAGLSGDGRGPGLHYSRPRMS